MTKRRVKVVQGELDLRERTHGGTREGAGRKRKAGQRDSRHRARPVHKARYPEHVVLRTLPGVGRLRRAHVYKAVRDAWLRIAQREDFRVVHASIQHNHLHLIVEAGDAKTLSRGMQALAIATARAINRSLGRTGKVFAYRYHATALTTPQQTRSALAYVLNNWRRHREHVANLGIDHAPLDTFSTGSAFDGWKQGRLAPPPGHEPLPSASPETWLLRVGWRKAGRALDAYAVPGPA